MQFLFLRGGDSIKGDDFILTLESDGYTSIDYRTCKDIRAMDKDGFMYKITTGNYRHGKVPHKFMHNPYANENLKTYFDKYFPNFELITKEYLCAKQEIYFICKKHRDKGVQHRCFSNIASINRGCHYCNNELNDKKVKTDTIIERCKELNLLYVDRYVKDYGAYVKYICPTHKNKGVNVMAWTHLKTCSVGCPYCTGRYKTTDDFKREMKNIHPNIKIVGEYKGSEKRVKCMCKKCNTFWSPLARSLKSGQGCPVCKISKGEMAIKNFLNSNNIEFLQQYSFDDCVYKEKLKFDFYIPVINTAIEFDGIQHFKPVDFASKGDGWAETQLEMNQKRDSIKNKYCRENKVNLIRIPYFKIDEIETILTPIVREFLLCKNS